MKYEFTKVNENYLKRKTRSKRSDKKLHLGDYAETLFEMILDVNIFNMSTVDEVLDIMYEHDSRMSVHASGNKTHIMVQLPTSTFNEIYVEQYCAGLLFELTKVEQDFANLNTITVQYGDAYYGEW